LRTVEKGPERRKGSGFSTAEKKEAGTGKGPEKRKGSLFRLKEGRGEKAFLLP